MDSEDSTQSDIEKLNQLLQTEPPDYKAIKNVLFSAMDALMNNPEIQDMSSQKVVLVEALKESDENLFLDYIGNRKMKGLGDQEN